MNKCFNIKKLKENFLFYNFFFLLNYKCILPFNTLYQSIIFNFSIHLLFHLMKQQFAELLKLEQGTFSEKYIILNFFLFKCYHFNNSFQIIVECFCFVVILPIYFRCTIYFYKMFLVTSYMIYFNLINSYSIPTIMSILTALLGAFTSLL